MTSLQAHHEQTADAGPRRGPRAPGRVAALIRARRRTPISHLLVVGCGDGREAAALAESLGCPVTGIDIRGVFDPRAASVAQLRQADARELPFPSASFDFVYSYHVLEHIPDYGKAVDEIGRVLVDRGGFWIGTPNRQRLVAYVGSKATLRQRLRWNMADWNARLRGRFRNELGAHAGFTAGELGDALRARFGRVDDATLDYFCAMYPRRTDTLRWLDRSGLGQYLFPSIYFSGEK